MSAFLLPVPTVAARSYLGHYLASLLPAPRSR